MQLKEMPDRERPQEKLLYRGVSVLSNAELLSLIIRTGTGDKSVLDLSIDVLSYCDIATGGLGRADAKELMKVDGIGEAKACAIVASMELAKRMISNHLNAKRTIVRDCTDVADLLMEEMMYEKRELLIELLLNVKGEVESKEVISIGELSATNVHPREVLSPAIRKGAAGIIIAHNHPSGDSSPSNEDIIATRRLAEASSIVGIKLMDHVIIGDGNYTSLRAEGIIS